jgi:hypothetical protein
MRPPRKALDRAPGHRLADICGGTANYALALKREGWERPWSTALPRCFAQDDLRASPPAPSPLPLRTNGRSRVARRARRRGARVGSWLLIQLEGLVEEERPEWFVFGRRA